MGDVSLRRKTALIKGQKSWHTKSVRENILARAIMGSLQVPRPIILDAQHISVLIVFYYSSLFWIL